MGPLEPSPTPADDDALTCPWCHSEDVERLSVYGPTHMTEQWFCRACHSPFDRVRNR